MLDILLLLNILLPVLTVWIYLLKYKSVVFDHITVFSFAFLYYWILPIFMGRLYDLFEPENEELFRPLSLWASYYSLAKTDNMMLYLGIVFLFYLCFVFGGVYKKRNYSVPSPRVTFPKKTGYNAISIVLIFLLLWLTASLKDFLFTGYMEEGSVRTYYQGMLSGLDLWFFSLYMIYNINQDYKTNKFFSVARNRYLIPYLICSFLLLSMGGRLYVISTIIMLLAYYTVYYRTLSYKKVFICGLSLLIVSGAIGVIRLGGELDGFLQEVVSNVVLEPLLTSISLLTFIEYNPFEIFGEPWIFLSYFANLIPRILFYELRQELSTDVLSLGYYYDSPLGALNSFVSLMICFGVFGSCIVLFFFGIFMSWLRSQSGNIARIIYSMLVGCIMFTFFRDPFSVSIIKNMIQNSIIIPIVWMLLLFGFSRIKR